MLCDKGHKVESWIIKTGSTKRHRVHCVECKVVIDFYRDGTKIKQKKIEYTDISFVGLHGELRDDNYWWMYGR